VIFSLSSRLLLSSPILELTLRMEHTSSRGRPLLILYVDDMIITDDDSEYIAFVKACLHEQFLMTNLGPLCYLLRIDVLSIFNGFYIS
jgi:hypothetical protein